MCPPASIFRGVTVAGEGADNLTDNSDADARRLTIPKGSVRSPVRLAWAMFYREPPEFDEVLRALQALEGEINSVQFADVFRADGVSTEGI